MQAESYTEYGSENIKMRQPFQDCRILLYSYNRGLENSAVFQVLVAVKNNFLDRTFNSCLLLVKECSLALFSGHYLGVLILIKCVTGLGVKQCVQR